MQPYSDHPLLVKDWLERWLDEKVRRDRQLSTLERYQDIINKQLIPYLGDAELDRLKPSEIDAMLVSLQRSGLASATVRTAHAVLSSAYREAVRLELVLRNPASAVSPPPKRRQLVIPPEVRVVRELLRLAREESNPLFPFLHLLTYTGMRRGEAMGLRWVNVNLGAAYLTVIETAVKTRTQGMVLSPPKTPTSQRTIDLDLETVSVLRAHHEAQIRAADVEELDPVALVFQARDGGVVKATSITRALKLLGERVGCPWITFHSLRHFHASVALQQHQNVAVVSRRLGHSSVTTTLDTYAHCMPGWQRSTAEAFARAMEVP